MRSLLLKRRFFLMSVFLNILMFTSCNKDVYETPSQVSLYEIIRQDKVVFTFLKAAIDRAGMQSLFENDKLNFVAPTNTAFINAGYKSLKMISEADPEKLSQVMRYHMLGFDVDLATVADGTELQAANNQKILVLKTSGNSIRLNGATVTDLNLQGTNGRLTVINKLLVPASGNIIQTIDADPNLIFFKAALVRASTGNTNLVQMLSGNSDYTVFALSNAGFSSTSYSTLALINSANANTLAGFLSYYISPGKRYTTQITNRLSITQLNGSPVFFELTASSGVNPLINGLRISSGSDQQATNGMVHVLDGIINAPTGTLNKTVTDLNLTFLAAAISRASTGDTNISEMLSGTEEFTFIAPSNAAFIAAGYANIAAINATPPNVLGEILKLHLMTAPKYILGIYNSSNANALYNYKTLAGKNITFQFITPAYTVKGEGNASAGTLSPNNYTCTNGVLHVSSILLN